MWPGRCEGRWRCKHLQGCLLSGPPPQFHGFGLHPSWFASCSSTTVKLRDYRFVMRSVLPAPPKPNQALGDYLATIELHRLKPTG